MAPAGLLLGQGGAGSLESWQRSPWEMGQEGCTATAGLASGFCLGPCPVAQLSQALSLSCRVPWSRVQGISGGHLSARPLPAARWFSSFATDLLLPGHI